MIPLFDNNQRRRTPVITFTLILANISVFGYQLFLAQQGQLLEFIGQFAFTPAFLVEDPSPETAMTIFTSMFLHGGWLHLVFNLWFLWLFGNMVEDRIGSVRYLFLYLLAGVGAAGAQFAVGPTSPIPMLGASGAIAGVLGAYLIFFPKAIIFTFIPVWFAPIIPVPAFIFLVLWFLLQIWQGVGAMLAAEGTGGVAWWAHFGGFVAGFFISRKWKKR
jgi:membrane associated rhomboid family serine protease